jgi:hypothetical protein
MAGYFGFGDPGAGGSPTPGGGTPSSGFDWQSALPYIQTGLQTAGGIAGGIQNAKTDAATLAERKREFDKAFGLQSGGAAISAEHALDSAPLRDRVLYKLQQILGQTPSQFKPHDIFNGGGVPQQGGYDTGKLQAADAAYKPGAGGVNTAMIQKFLASLGYPSPGSGYNMTTGAPNLPPPRVQTRIPQGMQL